MKKGKPSKGTARKAAPPKKRAPQPPPEPLTPDWGEATPETYETLTEWVDTVEID